MANHTVGKRCIKQIKIFFPANKIFSIEKYGGTNSENFHFCITWWILIWKIENCRNNPLSQFSRDVDEKWHVNVTFAWEDCMLVQFLFKLRYFLQKSYLDRLKLSFWEANQIHVSVPTKRIYNFFSFPEKEFWIEIKVKKKNETEPPVENYLKLNDNE